MDFRCSVFRWLLYLIANTNYVFAGVKRTSRTALSSLIKPASELSSSPPGQLKRKASETEKVVPSAEDCSADDTPILRKRKKSETEKVVAAEDCPAGGCEDTPIAKKRMRRNNPSVDNNSESERGPSPERKRHTSRYTMTSNFYQIIYKWRKYILGCY